jgi:hypothetical protein
MDHAIAYNIHVVLLSFIQLASGVAGVMGWITIGERYWDMPILREYRITAHVIK